MIAWLWRLRNVRNGVNGPMLKRITRRVNQPLGDLRGLQEKGGFICLRQFWGQWVDFRAGSPSLDPSPWCRVARRRSEFRDFLGMTRAFRVTCMGTPRRWGSNQAGCGLSGPAPGAGPDKSSPSAWKTEPAPGGGLLELGGGWVDAFPADGCLVETSWGGLARARGRLRIPVRRVDRRPAPVRVDLSASSCFKSPPSLD